MAFSNNYSASAAGFTQKVLIYLFVFINVWNYVEEKLISRMIILLSIFVNYDSYKLRSRN